MRIDPEIRTFQGVTTFGTFAVLNVLYLLACLPVLTAGAATSALLEVAMRYTDGERGTPLRDFLVALVRNAPRATLVLLVLGAPIPLLLWVGWFWYLSGSALSLVAMLIAGLAALYLCGALLHGLALVAAFEAGPLRTVRNALLLPGADPLRTAGLVLLPVGSVLVVLAVPSTLFLLLTIGCSAGAVLAALLLRPIYRRLTGDA
ncbi:YesL family protein [Brachybacterium saurashtrense]|uniref:DUF624 domain-containing protein n=1 Tax=Brachybacterium saurashtrense TaxID=556288 RepID=A0A345YS79_9MICO|nr:YesL family protein [Brachybacterium saurashtrense]AXK46781.1 DUF624 domain-containing protein [Brachybacterium saurashtrense]RRR22496.1 DUF624 domain-containing protein [Brachybacterium saurashtrense]